MSALQAALDLAARGIPCFPCLESKAPACAGGFKAASTDPDTVRRLFASGAPLIGVPTGEASGLDVLDTDPRNGCGAWLAAHEHLIPLTRIHATRSGGMHMLFRHRPGLRSSAGGDSGPRAGIDVKADGGYIIWWPAAGCQVVMDEDPATWPAALLDALNVREPAAAPANPADRRRLSPRSEQDVVDLFNTLPNPLHTTRDQWTFAGLAAIGCIHDLGADPHGPIAEAFVAWAERGDDTKEPTREKWEADWSRRPAHGVYAGYDTLRRIARELDPAFVDPAAGAEFEPLPPLPEPTPAPRRKLFGAPFELCAPESIEPREWVYGGHYIRQFISSTVAPGAIGKSSLALVEALDMVTGRGLLTGKPTSKRFRVHYWNGEDPIEETRRRVVAACRHYGITAADIGGRLTVASGRDAPIRIAQDTRDGFTIAEPMIDDLIAELRDDQVDVLILDPFVKTHGVNENDNNRIDAVASQFARIADAANVAVELVHHLRKASGTGQDRTAEDARGGVALISAARSVRVLNVMQPAEAGELGIPDEVRRRCFRVDDGKVNMVPPRGTGEHAVWRFLASVSLNNARPERNLAADNIGVATVWLKPAVGDAVTPEHVAEITRRLAAGEPNRRDARSPEWAGAWIAEVLGIDLATGGERKRVGKLIDAMVSSGALATGSELDDRRRARAVLLPAAPVAPVHTGADRSGLEQITHHPCSAPVSRGCGGLEQSNRLPAPVEQTEPITEDAHL